jgi:N-acetyl-gamma-glutamyl-phosphate reductase
LFPALKHGLIESDGIVIDAKSGVTGAGRAATDTTHYPSVNEAFAPTNRGAPPHTGD